MTRREDDPRHAGYLATFWAVARLGMALGHQLGGRLRASPVRGVRQRRGLGWGRPRLAMPRKVDPHQAGKQGVLAQAVVEAGPAAAILQAGASRLRRLPLIRAMWHGGGQPLRLPTPGTHVTRALFGALHRRAGRWGQVVRERMRTDDLPASLGQLLSAYPQGPTLLRVDNCRRHTAHAVGPWLAMHPRLHRYSLPKYGSPLTPVEPIWRRLTNTWAANRRQGSRP